MEYRSLGRVGLTVSALGFGAGAIGDPAMDEAHVSRLLHTALDLGITFFDTAPSYGLSEVRLGEHLRNVRQDVILSTKVGYGVPGHQDWTPSCIEAGVERALTRLNTSWIDIVHLHSCPLDVLKREGLLDALAHCKRAGVVRAVGYSGEGDALRWAIGCDVFDVVQCSVNICDQYNLDQTIPLAAKKHLGIIAKRSVANAIWRDMQCPDRPDRAAYWRRWQAMGAPARMAEDALRFTAYAPHVHICLIGTSRRSHLIAAVDALQQGPLPEAATRIYEAAYAPHQWPGLI